ncbi:homoserine dehydrogenase [Candidatus Omnitrophota bacterium]
MRKLTIGLIGFGNVGEGLVRILRERRALIRDRSGFEFQIKKICDKDFSRRRHVKVERSLLTKDFHDVIADPEIDIVVELIGGVHPAKEIIMQALKAGKHIVTANKALLAEEGRDVLVLAQKRRRNICFEAAVGAGIPVIQTLKEGLLANRIDAIYGIINGTSNFVLSRMSQEHCSFSDALQEAKKKGFAEARPRLDIEGIDSAHKLVILAYLAFGQLLKLKDVYAEGISKISLADIDYAHEMNLEIKLLAIAKKINNFLEVRIHPTLIPKRHLLASVNGIFNAIYIDSDLVGDLLLYGQGAGQMTAASAVVSDLISLAKVLDSDQHCVAVHSKRKKLKLRKIDEIKSRYYVRFMAVDKPGVLARISGVFGKHKISIASVSQKGRRRAKIVPLVMLTHEANERQMRLALEKIYKLAVIREYPVAIRMEREI